jgi:hypothetical protein
VETNAPSALSKRRQRTFERENAMKNMRLVIAFASALVLVPGLAGTAHAQPWGDRGRPYDRGRNTWDGNPRNDSQPRGTWAVGTFYGENSANGDKETVTIHPDGSVVIRSPNKGPQYGSFAGETLTVGSQISKVEPARGGIVIDGSYYRR